MKNILKYNKIMIVICMVIAISFNLVLNCYTIAASNTMNISGPTSVEEGKTITFNITFADNVDNIWLSDGDIIKKGFSGTVKVNKISDRDYTVVISNVASVGTGKYIIVNSGVGYIDGMPTDSVTSNVFEITAKQVVETPENNDNGNNDENNAGNENPDSGVSNTPSEKPSTGNNENEQKPSTEDNANNDNKPNTDSNTNNNTNTNNNQPTVDNTNTNQPTTDNTVNNVENNVDIQTEIEEVKIRREIPNTGKLI